MQLGYIGGKILQQAFQFATHFGPAGGIGQRRGEGHCRYNHLVKCEAQALLREFH